MTTKQHETELRRWQERIRDAVCEHVPSAEIDGGGCESGDPLEFTLCEIGQGFNDIENRAFDALQELGLCDAIPKGGCAVDTMIQLFTSDSWEPDTLAMRAEIIQLRAALAEVTPAAGRPPNGSKLSDGPEPDMTKLAAPVPGDVRSSAGLGCTDW